MNKRRKEKIKDSFKAKVIYFSKIKLFEGNISDLSDSLAGAYLYGEDSDTASLVEDYDDDYKKQAEVWDVEVTIETI